MNWENQIQIAIEIKAVRHRKGGFAVLSARTGDTHDEISVCGGNGLFDETRAGDWLQVEGQFQDHAQYGRRFYVTKSQDVDPTAIASPEALTKYLTQLPGVGTKAAERMSKEGLHKLMKEPELVGNYVSAKYKEKAIAMWQTMTVQAEIGTLLTEMSFSMGKQQKILEICGGVPETWRRLKEDPWSLAGEIPGVSFIMMDAVARRLGTPDDSPGRIRKGVAWIAKEACLREGHTVMEIDELVTKSVDILKVDEELVREQAIRAEELERVGLSGIGLRKFVSAEKAIADAAGYYQQFGGLGLSEEGLLKISEEKGLSFEQLNAMRLLNNNPFASMTGGPGTGKTTTLGAFVAVCRQEGKLVGLVAPTGLAARRLKDAAGQQAFTIHRFLSLVEKGAIDFLDAVIVDEASMVDCELAANLVRKLNGVSTRLLWIGDGDQLPPIGPGRPFKDLLDTHAIPVGRLTKIFRQKGQAVIPLRAKEIREGHMPDMMADVGWAIGIYGDGAQVEKVAAQVALRQVSQYGRDQCAVLSPMYKGHAGVNNLGGTLQQTLNPNSQDPLKYLTYEATKFAIDDPVIHISNDYMVTGLTHAMRGKIIAVKHGEGQGIEVAWEDGQPRFHEAPNGKPKNVVLGYALTWHRSQGSEWVAVTVVLTKANYMILSREALYTAVTRAKDEVVIIAEHASIPIALGKRASERRTALHGILLEMAKDRGFDKVEEDDRETVIEELSEAL